MKGRLRKWESEKGKWRECKMRTMVEEVSGNITEKVIYE